MTSLLGTDDDLAMINKKIEWFSHHIQMMQITRLTSLMSIGEDRLRHDSTLLENMYLAHLKSLYRTRDAMSTSSGQKEMDK